MITGCRCISTVHRRLNQGDGLDPDGLSLPRKASCCFCESRWRQCLACYFATLTMFVVGTINGWTTIAFHYLIAVTGSVPLMLTHDEYSWIVSFTIVGSIIGALVADQLADRSGRKQCLLVCSIMFTVGWFIIYEATSVPMLYFARLILGIGVGIAHTINPMYVSEVANRNIKGALGTLIVINALKGSLLTCTLGLFLTYKSLLTVLVIISFISLFSNTCFPETPYFLLAKGRKQQARKSIAYYKGIAVPHRVEFELHPQCAQTRHELHQQVRYELLQQSTSDLHSESRSNLPSQSTCEAHSDPIREVDIEATSDLHLPSSSDSHAQSISSVHSTVICEVHTQPTGESRVEYSRDSPRLPPQTSRELHSQSTSDLHRPTTSQVHRPSTSEIHPEATSEIHPETTSEIHPETTSEIHPEATSEIHPETTSEIHRPSTSEILRPSTSEVHRPSTRSNEYLRKWADIDEIHVDFTKYNWSTKLRAILQRSNRKALFIMLGLTMAQHLSGNYITTQYLKMLLSKTAVALNPYKTTLAIHIISILSGGFTIATVEYLGRRTLLIMSTLGTCCPLIILANYLLLVEHKFDVSISSIPISNLVTQQIMFQIGLGTLPNVLRCELFPAELRGFVGAIIVIFDGIIGLTVSKLYQVITNNIGSYANYMIFGASCCLAFMMVIIWIPETKGKTYREIEALLFGENFNCLNEEVSNDEMDTRRI
ncbi:facilitated trehalose transporter Tret1-like [Bombus vosnesenskii]|uniref:Facilitated trehalose transporter Tret1-like n=1 Tax=Bombus vosnesenskii TaxID=207650 RepID=A0A6J3LFI5_9HYME|nr:facilitated trehalose transporter Tret1-like [Bombus vosnesenskii]